MPFKPEEIWVVRHTYDNKSHQWVNVIRSVTKDEHYKDIGKDPYGNMYHDDPVDFKRDWPLIKKLGYDLPAAEFRKFARAAFGFGADKEKESLYVKGAEYRQLGQLLAKRAAMEASNLKPGPEKERRMGLAGALATGSHSYGEALKRNAPSGWDTAHSVADRYKLLGEIEGMIGQRPGADTQLPTLTPLLVGYIRHAKPEEIQQLSTKANVGDLDGILSQVGAAAQQWEQDPKMQQYPFASAANRFNSPTHAMDVAEQYEQGKLADVDQPQTYNPTYTPPNPVVGQQGGQPGQQEDPEANPSDKPQGNMNNGTQWTAPQAQQYRPAQKQPEAKPGDFGGSLGSMATNWGMPQKQVMFPYPRDPGVPPKISDYGAYIAAPTNQAALSQAMAEYQDVCKFYRAQSAAGLIDPKIAQASIAQAKEAYDQVHARLVADESAWKERLLNKTVYSNITNHGKATFEKYTFPGQDEDETTPDGSELVSKDHWELDLDALNENATPEQRNMILKGGAEGLMSNFGGMGEQQRQTDLLERARSAPMELLSLTEKLENVLTSMGANPLWLDTDSEKIFQLATNKSALQSSADEGKQEELAELLRQYYIWNKVYQMMLEEFPEQVSTKDINRASGAKTGPGSPEEDARRHAEVLRNYRRLMKGRWFMTTGPGHVYAKSLYKEFGMHNHRQFVYYLKTGKYPAQGPTYYTEGGPPDK